MKPLISLVLLVAFVALVTGNVLTWLDQAGLW